MYKTLETIREKTLEAEELSDQIERLSVAYKSQLYDGMPKGGSGDAMTSRIIAKEFIEKKRDALLAEVKGLESEVRKVMNKMPPNLYAFCTYYFLAAYSVAETCKIMDRDETTFYRYKREVREMLGE